MSKTERWIIWCLVIATYIASCVLAFVSGQHHREIPIVSENQKYLDKRITGNALMSDQAWNRADEAVGMAEENAKKIREILKRMEGRVP